MAKAIITNNREKMDELANYLLAKETITGEEFMHILKGTGPDETKAVETKTEEPITAAATETKTEA
ncbi:MAG: hypothetical protein LKE29_09430 [Acidaminococcaceae bacterium]|nr:hypothetical protein [Acidaminococcaceae bacterium]